MEVGETGGGRRGRWRWESRVDIEELGGGRRGRWM